MASCLVDLYIMLLASMKAIGGKKVPCTSKTCKMLIELPMFHKRCNYYIECQLKR